MFSLTLCCFKCRASFLISALFPQTECIPHHHCTSSSPTSCFPHFHTVEWPTLHYPVTSNTSTQTRDSTVSDSPTSEFCSDTPCQRPFFRFAPFLAVSSPLCLGVFVVSVALGFLWRCTTMGGISKVTNSWKLSNSSLRSWSKCGGWVLQSGLCFKLLV